MLSEILGTIYTALSHFSTFRNRAPLLNRKVSSFIKTPYEFDIELQTHSDVVDWDDNIGKLERLKIMVKVTGLEKDLIELFGKEVQSIQSVIGEKTTIKEAVIKGFLSTKKVDPNGVRVFN